MISNTDAKDHSLQENLHTGYIQTGAVYADMRPGKYSEFDLIESQVMLLQTDARPLFDRADSVRVYGVSKDVENDSYSLGRFSSFMKFRARAFDLKFSDSPEVLEFLVDSGRMKNRQHRHQSLLPSYDDLLCFFHSWETIPLGWWSDAQAVLYLTNPFKGVNRTAKAELQKYLKENESGAVLSICLTAFRSSIFIFPGSLAADPLWERLSDGRFGSTPTK